MTTTLTSRPGPVEVTGDRSFLLDDVSWEYYERTLEEAQSRHLHLRITYDRGRMEFMTTGARHEQAKGAIRRLIEIYALEYDIPVLPLGSVTCRREDLQRGLEPDECYYVTSQLTEIGDAKLDLPAQPPPDLVVEVDITRSSIPRQPIYAALGVPEIWRTTATASRRCFGSRTAPTPLPIGALPSRSCPSNSSTDSSRRRSRTPGKTNTAFFGHFYSGFSSRSRDASSKSSDGSGRDAACACK